MSAFGELRRHFFREYIENDLMSPGEDQHGGLSLVFAVLLLPGLLLPVLKLLKYAYPFWTAAERDVQSWNDKLLFVLLSMIVMTAIAAVNWEALQPGRRDALVLGSLPISESTVIRAKLASLGMLLALFDAAIMGVAPLTFPFVVFSGASTATSGEWLRMMAGHATATFAAGAFAFCAVVAVNGILLNVLTPRRFRQAGAWIQLAIALLAAVLFFLSPIITDSIIPLARERNAWLDWMPPAWFLGLYQTVAGVRDPLWSNLSDRAWLGLGVLVLAALGTQVAGYRRMARQGAAARVIVRRTAPLLRRARGFLARLVCGRTPAVRAFFSFTIHTLERSSQHRLVVAACLGTGLAFAAVGLVGSMSQWPEPGWTKPGVTYVLSVQYVLVWFLITGVRIAAALPSELHANWTFRLLDPGTLQPWLTGFRHAVLRGGVVPLLLACLVIYGSLLGIAPAAAHFVLGTVWAATLWEVEFLGFRQVPFACSFVSGRGGPKGRWGLYGVAFTLYVYGMAGIEAQAIGHPVAFGCLLAAAGGLLGILRMVRIRGAAAGPGPRFDQEDTEAVQALNLSL